MSNLRDKNVFKPQQTLVIFVKIIQFGKTTKNLKRIGFVKMLDLQTMENSKYVELFNVCQNFLVVVVPLSFGKWFACRLW